MNREEKIELLRNLLRVLVSLPNNSWLQANDAKEIFDEVCGLQDASKIDEYIAIISETLEKIWFKMKNTNNTVNKLIISDSENQEKETDIYNINNLFANF